MFEEGQKRKSTLFMPKAGKNKYEMVIVASREARRINEYARITGEPVTAKVTGQALRRALDAVAAFQKRCLDECLDLGLLPSQRGAADQIREKADLGVEGLVDGGKDTLPLCF